MNKVILKIISRRKNNRCYGYKRKKIELNQILEQEQKLKELKR